MVPESIIDQRLGRCLTLVWPDQRRDDLPYDALRLHCPCADCRVAREDPGAPSHTGMPLPEPLTVTGIQPVGHYALQLRFSDGHDRGIFPWQLLRQLGQSSHDTKTH